MTNIIIDPYKFVAAAYAPAAMVFNGTDEVLSRTNSTTTPSTIAFTISMWAKGVLTASNIFSFLVGRADANNFTSIRARGPTINRNIEYTNFSAGAATATEITSTNSLPNDGAWHHHVFRYDSANGTADNRALFELDSANVTDANTVAIGASEVSDILANGRSLSVGSHPAVFAGAQFKIAFVDFIDGSSLPSTDFAFDNAGTWTRKKYAGSYGTYGFSLDGSTGVLGDDVSVNGLDFTGTNMDASNLDTADLPPYTN